MDSSYVLLMYYSPMEQALLQLFLGRCTEIRGRDRWTCSQLHSMVPHIQDECRQHWFHMMQVFCLFPQQGRLDLPEIHNQIKISFHSSSSWSHNNIYWMAKRKNALSSYFFKPMILLAEWTFVYEKNLCIKAMSSQYGAPE